jgi:D-alanyl-D-alanine carboxypeptidase
VDKWLAAALDYIPRWIAHQMRLTEQPGCALAIAHKGKPVLDVAFGHADLARGLALTPRHRFRVASHSKTFTAAGVMKLREQGRLKLDDRIGDFVPRLHPRVAEVTLSQLLSHTAGLVRDGSDSGQWSDRRPFLNEAQIRADLDAGPTLDPNTRFKYSNHGFGLLGLAIRNLTGEPYSDWIAREIVAASGLDDTAPDAPLPRGTPLARGHSSKLPLGRRMVLPVENPTHALASATGFVSTAADLARFFGSLSPEAKKSVLSVASRREMARRQWREPHSSVERWYGLGTISGTLGAGTGAGTGATGWDWFGHSGGFQGTVTRTVVVPTRDLAVSVLTNATDGQAHVWLDGALHVLQAFERQGGPSRRTAAWAGRWWGLWGAFDLLPMAHKVLVANPSLPNPLMDASELEPTGRSRDGVATARIALANGYGAHGEPARLVHDARGRATEFWLAGNCLRPEAKVVKELETRYGGR